MMTLSQLKRDQLAVIKSLPNDYHLSVKLIEQGFVPNSQISLAHKAPFNGPSAFYLHGAKISLQSDVAQQIKVDVIS